MPRCPNTGTVRRRGASSFSPRRECAALSTDGAVWMRRALIGSSQRGA